MYVMYLGRTAGMIDQKPWLVMADLKGRHLFVFVP